MKIKRILSAATLATAFVAAGLVAPVPASAYVGADASTSFGPNGTSSSAIPTLAQGIANGDGTRGVAFSCTGLSTGDTASTGVSCTLSVNGTLVQRAQTIYLPGPVATTGGASVSVPSGARATVCAFVVSIFVVSPQLTSGDCTTAVIQVV